MVYSSDTLTSSAAAPSMTLSAPFSSTQLIVSGSREAADNAISPLTTHFLSLQWPQPTAIYGQPSPSWLPSAFCSKRNNKDPAEDSSALTNVCTGLLLSYRSAEEAQRWQMSVDEVQGRREGTVHNKTHLSYTACIWVTVRFDRACVLSLLMVRANMLSWQLLHTTCGLDVGLWVSVV